ncbi:phospholipase [Microbacterium aurantiacum]|uniref:aggregation-promoting factor C-terminal-like domain-containing protein n=1 Tax=Microbacterium aurantiacum TaxID=162393 RepID=UPI000C7FA37B|nr:phospholipase [Microbacterium aurantiacum]
MLHKTRTLRRASAVASARAAVTARRPMMILGTATAALLGAALTAGIVSAPAAGAEHLAPAATVSAFATGADVPAKHADAAAITVAEARDAVASADALTAEVAASGLAVDPAVAAVDTSDLHDRIDALEDRAEMPVLVLAVLTEDSAAETEEIVAGTAALQAAFTAAQEQKAAADAAQAAAEQAAAEAAAQAASLAATNTVDGAKATAQQMAANQYGWGADQFSCLESLWNKESGWNYQAYNDSSGATGIPQSLPGSKMASAGSDWETNAATQIAWGLGYISSVYGTPCGAWSHSQSTDWY